MLLDTTVHDNKMTDDINLDNPPLSRDPLYNGAQHHNHQQQQVYDIPLSLEPSIGTTGLEQQEGMVNDDTHDEVIIRCCSIMIIVISITIAYYPKYVIIII